MAASFRRAAALLVLLAQGSLSSGLPAQQVPAASPALARLTLKETVQLALKQNPQRIIARILVYESDRNSQIARSALLPGKHGGERIAQSIQYPSGGAAISAEGGGAVSGVRSWSHVFAKRFEPAIDSWISDWAGRNTRGARG